MNLKREPGYESQLVSAFFTAHGERRADGTLTRLNDRRVDDSHRETLRRWAQLDVVPLIKLDTMLMRYDLMLFEYEQWAEVTFGRDGFTDPYSEPKELAV